MTDLNSLTPYSLAVTTSIFANWLLKNTKSLEKSKRKLFPTTNIVKNRQLAVNYVG